MATEYKEQAKTVFGFKTVPFYVFVNANGDITQMGGPSKINLERLPGVDRNDDAMDKENGAYCRNYNSNNVNNNNTERLQPVVDDEPVMPSKQIHVVPVVEAKTEEEQLFVIDDLDF